MHELAVLDVGGVHVLHLVAGAHSHTRLHRHEVVVSRAPVAVELVNGVRCVGECVELEGELCRGRGRRGARPGRAPRPVPRARRPRRGSRARWRRVPSRAVRRTRRRLPSEASAFALEVAKVALEQRAGGRSRAPSGPGVADCDRLSAQTQVEGRGIPAGSSLVFRRQRASRCGRLRSPRRRARRHPSRSARRCGPRGRRRRPRWSGCGR